ncbi:hypothetical protein OROMI_010496 [Orobanche minor]
MAAYAKLDDLNKNRIDWKIQVRCCRKWQVPAHGNFSKSLELLLVDKFGTRIQASVKGHIIDRFVDLIIEGGLYLIEQFSVVDRPKNFPVAVHPFKISFHKNTYVGPTVSTRFPKTVFSFRSFSDIKSGSSKDEAPLFDIIGTIIDYNDSRMKEDVAVKGNRNIHLLLEDLEKTKLQCVLWDPYCHQVQNLIERLKNRCGGYSVVIIQLCRAKNMRGEIGVSNTFYATKVVADQQLDEIVEYISNGSQLSNSSFLNVRDELESASCVFMTLAELKSSDIAVKVWVTCSISDVLFEKDWCYTSCLKCRRKVSEKEGQFFCEKCGNYVVGNARFKIHIKVVDGKSSAIFLLWDDIARMLIGTSASNICERLALESAAENTDLVASSKDVCRLEQPYEVDNLIGRELLFKVGIDVRHLENRDNVYVVERVCEDAVLIKEHKLTDHKVLDFQSRPYEDIVQDNDWDPEPSDFDHESKSPEHVLGKRTEVSSGEDILNECEGSSSSKRRVVKEEPNDG